ncbi:MAG: DUF4465 domain-containing protein [Bacteroidales bacterium]|nr:DUF4465 domain-containing protein [Bacteroidales bacterium]
MKKNIFFALVSAMFLLTACQQHEIDSPADLGDGFTLVGHSDAQTKTAFGTPDANTIPFLWSEGDVICVGGNYSEPLTAAQAGGNTAEFAFTSGTLTSDAKVYYGGLTAEDAIIPSLQSGLASELGVNCELGYGEVEENGTFTLEHLSSYIWLNTYSSIENLLVSKVIISAENDIVGMADFNSANKTFSNYSVLEDVPELSSANTIELFQVYNSSSEEYESSPTPVYLTESSDEEIWAVAVTYPVTTGALNITYVFEDGNGVEVGRASYTYPSKTLEAGCTYRISQEIKAEDLYTLRTLTFEDADAKFESYECTFNYAMGFYEETKFVEKWSDYIPTDTRYGSGHGSYEWYDENNTELAFVKPTIPSWWGISGHAGISNYVGNDIKAEGDEPSNLFMRDLEAFNVTGGANGSKNFCTQYGYLDPDEYATMYSPEGVLPGIQFYDEQPRVIDHMYVTNTTYAYAVLISGECDFGGSYQYTDESTFKIVAYGYDSFEDTEPTSTEFYLLNTGKRMITDWTKWDLSVLGEVVRVEFNLVACDNGYGIYGNVIPAYFAYDDVAVRFPANK